MSQEQTREGVIYLAAPVSCFWAKKCCFVPYRGCLNQAILICRLLLHLRQSAVACAAATLVLVPTGTCGGHSGPR